MTLSKEFVAVKNPDGSLDDARWTIADDKAAVPFVALTRTDTVGGGSPASCPAGATNVTVPFTAQYVFYSCEGGIAPMPAALAPAVEAAAGAGVRVQVAFAAVAALVAALV